MYSSCKAPLLNDIEQNIGLEVTKKVNIKLLPKNNWYTNQLFLTYFFLWHIAGN